MNKKLILIVTITIFITLIIAFIFFINKPADNEIFDQINLGDIVTLNENDKELLRNKSIEYIKNNLKAPSTALFEEPFEYECSEPNIIKVSGYLDSQNGFGAMIRGNFHCEYFAIDDTIDILVYLKINDDVILDIKDTYMEEYKNQEELNAINKDEKNLNQEKLDYIMEKFNNDELNDVGKIVKANFNDKESVLEVEITAKTEMSDNYWINYNICSIMDYLKEFDIIGNVKIILADKKSKVEVCFDNEFMKNKWQDNHRIDLVEEIFGENYKVIK